VARYKVLLTDYAWPDLVIERAILAEYDAELVVAPATDEATLVRLAPEADAIMTNWVDVRAPVIDAAARCQIIARLGIGLDSIDVWRATERGIPVTNVPDYCLVEVAEHTLALVLALARKLHVFQADARAGRYDLSAGMPLMRIAGQTLGIVGLGRIGREVADRAAAFGLRVWATSRSHDHAPPHVRRVELDELLGGSDFVTLHVPLTKHSWRMMGPAELAMMKPSAFLINTSRGGLVDQDALAAALAANRLAGAGLDVHDPEPPDLSRPPYTDPRVIVTPHAAFYSEESVAELRRRAARQVGIRLSGGRPEHVVNPEVLDR
jgi:D-3-phosphoglycerate dehydrogenase / 2-oxoglutarate reductase